jgi:hypothetical protein
MLPDACVERVSIPIKLFPASAMSEWTEFTVRPCISRIIGMADRTDGNGHVICGNSIPRLQTQGCIYSPDFLSTQCCGGAFFATALTPSVSYLG